MFPRSILARPGLRIPRIHPTISRHIPLNLTTAVSLQITPKAIQPAIAPIPLQRRLYALNTDQHRPAPRKPDDDDPYAINTEKHEYSQSGSDSAVAEQKAAWERTYMTPEEVRIASMKEAMLDGHSKDGPLEVSPANPDFSKYTDEFGRGEWVEKHPSKRVSPPKGKKVDYGGAVVDEKQVGIARLAKVRGH
ncbi:hypothetical protein AJ79_06169 [Helicocarpus griseus UAMH5409]|uniref:Uncharacterized protein n=1 Tax=Helicocarpus griseus UAMH5409 TaxID=1447875 RepID=A0A2B7XG82_9EURO|nr:hypothetical protein AJ79_06169 [Helicocarpus griseus UAMH5409]